MDGGKVRDLRVSTGWWAPKNTNTQCSSEAPSQRPCGKGVPWRYRCGLRSSGAPFEICAAKQIPLVLNLPLPGTIASCHDQSHLGLQTSKYICTFMIWAQTPRISVKRANTSETSTFLKRTFFCNPWWPFGSVFSRNSFQMNWTSTSAVI